MISIGLDPSLTGFGWSVFYGASLVTCGVWRTERDAVPGKVAEDNQRRFAFVSDSLVELLEQERSNGDVQIFVEQIAMPHGRSPALTVSAQGRARGLVDGIAAAMRVPVAEVPSHKIKRLVVTVKRRSVEKEEVRDAIFELYPNARAFLPAGKTGLNASDAIAVAHVGLAQQRFEQQFEANYQGRA